jgi:hypothetical protein
VIEKIEIFIDINDKKDISEKKESLMKELEIYKNNQSK